MYQPYPSGDQRSQARREPPASVRRAVLVMYAGAALSVAGVVVTLVSRSSLLAAIRKAHPLLSAARVAKLENFDVVTYILIGVLGACLWIWMATANKAGNSRARTTASVIFAVNTIAVLVSLARPEAVANKAAAIVIWLTGLVTIVLLWQRDASTYYDGSGRVA
jgi:hypothetical protein